MMIEKEKKMTTITEYAHLYLQGYETVPLGVLAKPEFKAEVRRLWGPAPTAEEKAAEQARLAKKIAMFEKALAKLRGPRGGIPKVGRADYLYNARILEAMKRGLE